MSQQTALSMVTRSGRQPLRVTWEYKDGSKVCANDVRAKARLFDALLRALGESELRDLERAIADIRVSNLDKELAQKLTLEERIRKAERLEVRMDAQKEEAQLAPPAPEPVRP